MKLATILSNELDRLALPGHTSSEPLVVDTQGGRLEAAITTVEKLAVAFEQLTYRNPRLDAAPVSQLQDIAGKLARQLSYLLESISPVEIDREGCVVQMRSTPPQEDDQGTSYYELVVRQGELSLCRYAKSTGTSRRRLPAHMTREVFCRLAQDLVNAVS